jgi:hypothetical protein
MQRMFAAEGAILVHFKLFRTVFLVFERVVVPLLALAAAKHDLDPCVSCHIFGTSLLICLPVPATTDSPVRTAGEVYDITGILKKQ